MCLTAQSSVSPCQYTWRDWASSQHGCLKGVGLLAAGFQDSTFEEKQKLQRRCLEVINTIDSAFCCSKLATRPRPIQGAGRWNLSFNGKRGKEHKPTLNLPQASFACYNFVSFIHVVALAGIHSFSLLYRIPWYDYHNLLLILPLMDTWFILILGYYKESLMKILVSFGDHMY